jgi:NAD(P)-dependent dehydrogenase (short-subunit alcohol dehydrogenase family)
MLRLDGKRALVTGAAGGIGLGIARILAEAGAIVVINDLSPETAREAASAVGPGTEAAPGDVSDPDQAAHIVALASDGGLDILVNNAGIAAPLRSLRAQQPEEWQQVMDVNLRSAWLMSRAAGAPLRQSAGCIVNMASIAGITGFPASHSYGVSKAALVMLTKTMATELARSGVRVNAVAPGVIDAPMFDHMASNAAQRAATIGRVPLGRLGTSKNIGHAVAFLASDMASYITGVVLPVDGGWLAYGGVGPASIVNDARETCSASSGLERTRI